jgi:hypothetical protein
MQAFIKGLPEEVDPEIWEPILQNHFVSAGVVRVTNNSNLLMVRKFPAATVAVDYFAWQPVSKPTWCHDQVVVVFHQLHNM